MEAKKQILYGASLGISAARSLNYTIQGLWLPVINRLMNGKSEKSFQRFQEHLQVAFPKVKKLLNQDADNIAKNYYPIEVLTEDSFLSSYRLLPAILWDIVRAQRQKKKKENAQFDPEAQSFLKDVPEYYKRNFHFQDSGYLSDHSADLYEHQVEVLFSGTARAMRRQIIVPLKKHFRAQNFKDDGEGLKILEVASGTGALTMDLALAFPKAKIICLDPSPHYLKKSQENLASFKNISFLQGFAESMEFKDESFDAVVSCYLFHELPMSVREAVLTEKHRVLKDSGFLGIVDSIQTGDDSELQWALDQFPADFHEPFYKNYVEHSLEDLFKSHLDQNPQSEIHFLTKIVHSVKGRSLP